MTNRYEPRFPAEIRDVVSKSIDGNSDLVVWAPIKQGFIDSFGNVTYASRLRIVAEALNKLRKNVREFQLLEPFADPTKRILSLLDFRIGVVERDIYGFGGEEEVENDVLRPREYMYLTATFDGPWEPYMRQIWQPMGVFLDLVLCNCEGYLPAQQTNYEDYINWVRSHLLDTAMFYVVSGRTVKDQFYLQEVERIQRETEDLHEQDVAIATLAIRSPEEDADEIRLNNRSETMKLALEALNVLYQLTRYYPPDSKRNGQGAFLLNATRVILQDLPIKKILEDIVSQGSSDCCDCDDPASTCELCREKKKALLILSVMQDQLEWYSHEYPEGPQGSAARPDDPEIVDTEIQKGILSSYDSAEHGAITNGALLLIQIKDPGLFRHYLHPAWWSWEGDLFPFFRNLALTFQGLEKLAFTQKELAAFPREFREGMEDRAPMFGDTHHNHPQRWSFPPRNAFTPQGNDVPVPSVSFEEVDAVVQLRSVDVAEMYILFENELLRSAKRDGENQACAHFDLDSGKISHIKKYLDIDEKFESLPDETQQALLALLECIEAEDQDDRPAPRIRGYLNFLRKYGPMIGLELVSIQSAYRAGVSESEKNPFVKASTPKGHFGFRDGISQPEIAKLDYDDAAQIENSEPMQVSRGDLVLGFSNLRGDYATQDRDKALQQNGSFLAIRKMQQNVAVFNKLLSDNCASYDTEHLAGKMMGRMRNGAPLIKPAEGNTFDYSDDPYGLQCPLTSHIRRANPREITHRRKSPKILRRGMTYGKRYSEDQPEDTDRGLIFMAYCSSLAEQYEIIQGWVNGANSTNAGSAQFDPILSPQPKDGEMVFRYAEEVGRADSKKIEVKRVRRDPDLPLVKLEWGVYSFVPAKATLQIICERLAEKNPPKDDLVNSVSRGREIVERINALATEELKRKQWKVLLEDPLTKDPAEHKISPDVWNYFRTVHDGVYNIDSGVEGRDDAESKQKVLLVTKGSHIDDVLSNPKTFSVGEIGKRLKASFASHYIGMDPGNKRYYPESKYANAIIYDYPAEQAFNDAYAVSTGILNAVKMSRKHIFGTDKFKIELTREYIAQALAQLCKLWFGLPEEEYFKAGGWAWDQTAGEGRLARCPGDFFAPSRGSFYPRPTEAIAEYGKNHGKRLLAAVQQLVAKWEQEAEVQGILSAQMYKKQPDYELLGRNVIGAMIGMLPPSEANLRGVIFDWLDKGTLWRVQGALMAETKGKSATFKQAESVILTAMTNSVAKRPAPDLLYRTATKDGTIGGKSYEAGDLVIVSLVSATQDNLSEDNANLDIVFGGSRKGGSKNPGGNPHACPAQKMATGAMLGILTALMESGRIMALPASMILEVSDWSDQST